ncbi:hypothetical protein E4U23_006012 [Claviceps purpurea]|nr:hypothetical protein E4U36_005671 [Claviceps purpurea]KAG6244660.1 hypothetical protein E4U23_006012 [Claviceps purpurea]
MDQQFQFDALLECIRKLQIKETDTPSKRKIESLLQQEHDRLLRQNQAARETLLRIEEKDRQLQEKETALKEKEAEAKKKDTELENKEMEIKRKDIETKQKVIELQEKSRLLEEKSHELRNKDRIVEEKDRMLEEKDRMLEEKDRMLEERDHALRKSNFCEYIEQCNASYEPTVEPDVLQRTEIGLTKLIDRFKPNDLRHWSGFLGDMRLIFDKLCDVFPSDLRIFPRLITVQEIGSKIRPIANEKALEMFINTHVEGPVRDILNMLHSVDPSGRICQMEGDIDFIYHHRNIDENPGSVSSPVPEPAPSQKASTREKDFRPDGMCVVVKRQAGPGRNILIFPYECKAPHNLQEDDLVAVFRDITDFWEAKNPGGISQHAFKQVRHALMQVYDYMIRSLAEFGILTTGRAIVFLRVDWVNGARTLYYHLARPASDITQAPEDATFLSAVGQYVSFIVMALRQSRDVDQKRRTARMATRTTLSKANMGSTTTTKDAAGASTSRKSRAMPSKPAKCFEQETTSLHEAQVCDSVIGSSPNKECSSSCS